MPAEESTAAIVLRARDYSESDRIVTLLTREFGKLSGIAKGAKASRRRFERKLEPFSHVNLFFRRRPHGQLVFITRAEPGDSMPPPLEDDLAKIALGSYMLELADALTSEEAEATAAYRVLGQALETLGGGVVTLALRQSFELNLLRATGFGLEFGRCRICGGAATAAGDAVYFVVARGGIVCARCRPQAPEGAVRVAAANAAALAALAAAPVEHAAVLTHASSDGALAIARFLASILDRRLRSVEFLDCLL
ncbi:MAG TPA: DNA repair protein RecO [Candidatus Binataceae bacterium]|jgi:DNA repair protein RecO (recombination protein O)|nr:DNA repair protein RecO [Candidatus Binataceae bacterium]